MATVHTGRPRRRSCLTIGREPTQPAVPTALLPPRPSVASPAPSARTAPHAYETLGSAHASLSLSSSSPMLEPTATTTEVATPVPPSSHTATARGTALKGTRQRSEALRRASTLAAQAEAASGSPTAAAGSVSEPPRAASRGGERRRSEPSAPSTHR
eukprot:scaffold99593_cov32-Tisochrysis_lutea.AAC.1